MIAGAYLGTVGLELLKSAAADGFFGAATVAALATLDRLETRDLDAFAADFRAPDRANPLDDVFADATDAACARQLVQPVFARAAVLSAVQLAAFAVRSGGGRDAAHPVAIMADGSTWYKTRTVSFDAIVRRELDRLLVADRAIHYEILPQIEDAPMIGAAIAALS